jgi:protein-tyrosine-phosphatase
MAATGEMRDDAAPLTRRRGVVERLRAIAADLVHLPERLRHAARRDAIRQRIASSAPYRSALFMCHGNICRSPFAEAVFARAMGDSAMAVRSAGFIGPGRNPPGAAIAAGGRRGIDVSTHQSAVVTPAMVAEADLIVVMAADQEAALRQRFSGMRATVVVLGDLDPLPITRRTIRDPWGQDESVFDESFERIERCLGELIHLVKQGASRSA